MRAPPLLRGIVLLYLALLPVGLFWVVPVAGATASGADVLLGGMVVAGLTVLAWRGLLGLAGGGGGSGPAQAPPDAEGRGGPAGADASRLGWATSLLVLFGLWAALSALWSHHGEYALAKGVGYTALAAGAACIAWSGVSWRRALDAWLLGTATTVAATLLLLLFGSDVWTARVAYLGGSVAGLPLPRLRGPFLHPNGYGDYLLISGVFLWARWPALTDPGAPTWKRSGAGLLLGTLLLFLVLSVSSAWLAAGVLILFWGRRTAGRAAAGRAPQGASIRALGLRALGAAVTGVTLAGLVTSVRLELGGFAVTTGGVRPRIWASAVRAVLESPLVGVGAAPYLAEAADPLSPGGPQLWDAHDVYLSVLGQFGAVGAGLLAAGVWLLWRGTKRVREEASDAAGDTGATVSGPTREAADGRADVGAASALRARALLAVQAALLAMALHGLVIAGEDFRHWWAVLGLVGLFVRWRE